MHYYWLWWLNVIAFGLLVTLSFIVPDAEASYHDVAVVGDFAGKFDHKSIYADGDFRISNNKHMFTLLGDFEKDGRDKTYNINCNYIKPPKNFQISPIFFWYFLLRTHFSFVTILLLGTAYSSSLTICITEFTTSCAE